jgi:hypothetical protein
VNERLFLLSLGGEEKAAVSEKKKNPGKFVPYGVFWVVFPSWKMRG